MCCKYNQLPINGYWKKKKAKKPNTWETALSS